MVPVPRTGSSPRATPSRPLGSPNADEAVEAVAAVTVPKEEVTVLPPFRLNQAV
jgi:hypothetical protein